ncbi:uncharacterized protein LOC110875912 isoform X2 [Helianthus annuus]|uniref:uncharacterized protein LOC110875912 isoform X2 n=1 Tax=Helianthus annuus TaxID=4232 RepID=UPI00165312F7|nr:uncharacterized protein LOC110875912 isoform X2 [Helianthus annuus]
MKAYLPWEIMIGFLFVKLLEAAQPLYVVSFHHSSIHNLWIFSFNFNRYFFHNFSPLNLHITDWIEVSSLINKDKFLCGGIDFLVILFLQLEEHHRRTGI